MFKGIKRDEPQHRLGHGERLVEVLSPIDHAGPHIPGAINIPLKDIGRLAPLQMDVTNPVIVYCHEFT